MIYSDTYRLNQILSGLMHNALKFTSKGLIEFGYKVLEEKTKLHFFVKDSGRGILFEKAQSIFDKFEKLEEDNTKNEGGIGLGLTLAKGLIELLGGEIWFENNEFKGTTFHFTIDYFKENISDNQPDIKTQASFV
jgi:K+-sensing histidine kinase KdpD